MARHLIALVLASQVLGCYANWDWPKAPPKNAPNNCVQLRNGRYYYVIDCNLKMSDSEAVLPP